MYQFSILNNRNYLPILNAEVGYQNMSRFGVRNNLSRTFPVTSSGLMIIIGNPFGVPLPSYNVLVYLSGSKFPSFYKNSNYIKLESTLMTSF